MARRNNTAQSNAIQSMVENTPVTESNAIQSMVENTPVAESNAIQSMVENTPVAESNAIQSMVDNTPIVEPIKCDIKTLETLRESVAEKTAGAVHVVKQYADTLCAYFANMGIKDWVSESGKLADNESVKAEKTAFVTACEKRSHANPSKAWSDVVKYAKRALYGIADRGTASKLPFTESLIKDFRAIESRLQSDKNNAITPAHIDIMTKYIRPAIDALKKIG